MAWGWGRRNFSVATFCFLLYLFFLKNPLDIYRYFPFPSPHSEQTSLSSLQALDQPNSSNLLFPPGLTWFLLTFDLTVTQDSFHFWPAPNYYLHLICGSHNSSPIVLSSWSALLTYSEGTFRGICIFIKSSKGDFPSIRGTDMGHEQLWICMCLVVMVTVGESFYYLLYFFVSKGICI